MGTGPTCYPPRVFFVLSKLLDVVVDPLWWVLAAVLGGVVLLARGRRRGGLGLVSAGLGLLFLASLPAVSNRLWAALETADVPPAGAEPYDAVVLLGGAVSPLGSVRDEPAWNDNIERLLVVRELLLSGRAKVALLSGGKLGGDLFTEAEYLAKELATLGVPADRLVVEPKANNTRENATESKALLDARGAKRVLLVTSAFHMTRAKGCFRAVGIEADALSVDFRVREPSADPHLAPRGEYLSQTTRALREAFGRLVYRVMGYTR